jgi:hypothetical protein
VCADDGTFTRCTSGGVLVPDACDAGCIQSGTLDGLTLGYCSPRCAEGSAECLGGPLYRECVAGRWSVAPKQCAAGQPCNPITSGALAQVRCGGACDGGAVEVCGSTGDASTAWALDRACELGRCVQAGQQAQCQADCSPGQHQCAYDGAQTDRSCGDAGLWGPEVPCVQGTTCRLSGSVALGCAACVGSNVAGGNAYGAIDSACQDGGLSTCGPDNTYAPAAPCEAGSACVELTQQASRVASCEPLP